MKTYVLDHLSDSEFDRRIMELYDTMGNALTNVLDKWVTDNVIDDDAKMKMLSEWDNDKWNLFKSTLG